MKLVVISAAFPPDPAGEADHAMHLCERLAKRGIAVHVLTTKRSGESNNYPFALYPIIPSWGWPDLPLLVRFLRRCSPDAVLLLYTPRDYNYNDMITFTPTIARAALSRTRIVTQLVTALMGPQGSLPARVIRKGISACIGQGRIDYVFGTLLNASDQIIVLSEKHRASLSRYYPQLDGKSMVIPPPPLLRIHPAENGAARQSGRDILEVKPDDFLIGYYGYLYKEKGIETLLTAMAILKGKGTRVRLAMIGGNPGASQGSSYLETLKEMAVKLGIAGQIMWTGGYTPDSDEGSLYLRAADACVFPFSHGVTLNRSSVAAAAAHGLPIVTTRGAVLETAFVDRENVLLCPPGDAHAIATAIDSLMGSPELRQRLSAGALSLADEWFSWERTLEATLQALRT